MTVDLRPYQVDLLDRVLARLRAGESRGVLVAVTGAGKTVMAAAMIGPAAARGKRVLFLAHRRELIGQASAKLAQWDVAHGIVQAGVRGEPGLPVQVASVQTLARRLVREQHPATPAGWRGSLPPGLTGFDLVVIDECHHVTASQYQEIVTACADAAVIGLTATPYRLDGSGLGDVFDWIEAGPQVAELVRLGFLVPPVVYAPPSPEELSRIRLRAGDVSMRDAAGILDKTAPIAEIVASWRLRAAGRTSVGFACTVEHAQHLAAAFVAAGIPATAVDGAMAAGERAARLQDLAEGRVRVLFNCAVLTEGWDLPTCSCVILARPTHSRCLWRQMIGRGLRAAAGKRDCVILDHVGSVHRFGRPDADDRYSLDGERKGDGLLRCPDCEETVGHLPCCPACGWVVPLPEPRATDLPGGIELQQRTELDLELAARGDDLEERRLLYLDWMAIARAKGYNPGWAAHRYRDRFGTWPPRPWAAGVAA